MVTICCHGNVFARTVANEGANEKTGEVPVSGGNGQTIALVEPPTHFSFYNETLSCIPLLLLVQSDTC